MDLVLLANGLTDLTSGSTTTLLTTAAILFAVFFLLFSQFGKRLHQTITELMFTNWRLGLLGLTGVVLSVASGWTTWDGMSNFTREPVLSALVTFGIQGVMLIVAWLIGESFATGMSHRPKRLRNSASTHSSLQIIQPIASSVAGILLFTAIGIVIYTNFFASAPPGGVRGASADSWDQWVELLTVAAPVVIVITLLIVNAGSDVLEDYTQSLRIMIRSAVLWVMFLACMATSVFFSFDSLFSTIFPASERQRAADLRAQNQVAGIVNDIASLSATRRLTEREALFSSDAWERYSASLDRLNGQASTAGERLREIMEQKLREQQNELNRFQEDKSSAEAQQVALVQRKAQLNTEIGRLKEQVSGLTPEVTRLKTEVFEKDREVIAKKAEAEAEAGGIGVTSLVGRGPKYREIKKELDRTQEEKQNLQLQLREYQSRLDAARKRLADSEGELRQTDGEIAKLRSRSETASRLIVSRTKRQTNTPEFDASRGLQELAAAREEFRRNPTADGLTKIQTLCGGIVAALNSKPDLKGMASGINCDPGAASEPASRIFAINAGIARLGATCVGGDKLPSGGADVLFGFARKCVQDAGLPSRDTDQLRQQINYIELNRDDKAHRFVVTSNAFQDGNKLAYLALSIAIAIDALVFMSGLFGANAVRSPLSDVPSHKGRSARQLEDVIENALLPDKFENANVALDAILPTSMAPRELGPGWTHECVLPEHEISSKLRVLKVLNAGATIGAVRRDETYPARYFVRGELVEFLNQVSKTAFEKDQGKVKLSELRKIVSVALQPYVSDHADIVLGHMHPISDKDGFTSEIYMSDVPADDVPIVQRALNAGSTLDYVVRDERREERDRFYVHKEFYRTLAMISAENPKYGRRLTFGNHQLMPPDGSDPLQGGALHAAADAQLGSSARHDPARQIEDDTHREPAAPETAVEPHSGDRQAFVGELIAALSIKPGDFFGLTGGPSFPPALSVGEQFAEEAARNGRLAEYFRQRDRHVVQRLDEAERAIDQRLDGPDVAFQRQMLADARSEIEQNWSLIMLLPNGPYEALFNQMIEQFETDSGEGALTAEKERALKDAYALKAAIADNPRSTPNDWKKLGDDFERAKEAGDAGGEVVPMPERRAQ